MVKFKILAIPWFSLNFQLFMTEGEEPRSGAEANFGLRHPAGMMPCKPNISSPRAPADLSRREFPEGKVVIWRVHAANFSSRLAFYMDQKNWTVKSFSLSEQPQGLVRTSFGCCSICSWEIRA